MKSDHETQPTPDQRLPQISRVSRQHRSRSMAVLIAAIPGGVLAMVIAGMAWNFFQASGTRPLPSTAFPAPTLTLTASASATLITPSPTESPVPPTLAQTPTPANHTGIVITTGGEQLRLRTTPEQVDNVIGLLDAGTPLILIGRTADNRWLQVKTLSGTSGWVVAKWVQAGKPVETLALVALTPTRTEPPAIPIPTTDAAAPADTSAPPEASPTPDLDHPYISNITARAREIYQAGRSLGNRPAVFSKVGDSITANDMFLVPIGTGQYNLREYVALQPVIDYYSAEQARDNNSFANTSLAATSGWSARHPLDPSVADPVLCGQGESPLVCEYRLVRPSLALIMLGTNDVLEVAPQTYEGWMRLIIELSLERGVIPVLSTIPPYITENGPANVSALNDVVKALALEYQIPLWDYWAALQGLPDYGLWPDGVHPSWGNPADFTPDNLRYGMAVRNLTALQALDAIWKKVLK
jgi:hypothetical protein